ncbi:MAG: hypothetical protein ACFFAE_18555 [Candidatus Hodarchaeota archaeon]
MTELPIKSDLSPLCGYSLPSQTHLIEERTNAIVPSTQIQPSKEEFEDEKKGSPKKGD